MIADRYLREWGELSKERQGRRKKERGPGAKDPGAQRVELAQSPASSWW